MVGTKRCFSWKNLLTDCLLIFPLIKEVVLFFRIQSYSSIFSLFLVFGFYFSAIHSYLVCSSGSCFVYY
ncbi:uncharacterized protein DS421_12g376310 [Arachis hypogaea]|nr:uncharacterized protein DS421_12g376310 [Arachis hypogaea]